MPLEKQLRVNIIGAGLSGGALANSLLNDPEKRFKVQLFERDDMAFSSERGGYQIRLGKDGIWGLRECLDPALYAEMRGVWGNEMSRAPAVINPITGHLAGCLNDLKVYPKSRAIPRSALKDFLLRKPLAEDAVRLGKKLVDIKTGLNTYTGNTEVTCVFNDGSMDVCDILVAADGSKSVVNRLMGINNSMPVAGTGVQGRGPISEETYRKLPKELIKHGSLLMMGGKVQGFAAVYETNLPSSDGTAKNGSFLFWSIAVSDEVATRVARMVSDEEKHQEVMSYLATCPLKCQLLPEIVSHGLTNIKTVNSTTSQPPGDWRAGREHLGRIIFIGDAIHPMTAGRGQGANQAMRDAGVLQNILKTRLKSVSSVGNDREIMSIAAEFDEEMYKRAFAWVKSSSQATQLNLSDWRHRVGLSVLFTVLSIVGFGISLLEFLRLRSPDEVKF